MSIYVDEKEATAAYNEGVKIGETQPSEETEGYWWEVFMTPNGPIACAMTECGVSYGERITEDEFHLYIDDTATAKAILTLNVKY